MIGNLLLRTNLTERHANGSSNVRASKALAVERLRSAGHNRHMDRIAGSVRQAIQELLRDGTTATGGISEQHDRRTWVAMAAIVGDDRPELVVREELWLQAGTA